MLPKPKKDILCNKCGESLYAGHDFEGLIEAKTYGGYDSVIGDGAITRFNLCEHCLLELHKTFKIQPRKTCAIYEWGEIIGEYLDDQN